MDFFQKILPPLTPSGGYVFCAKAGNAMFNLDVHDYDMGHLIKAKAQEDLWFGLAEFRYHNTTRKIGRKAENAYTFKTLAFDVDAGEGKPYTDWQAAKSSVDDALDMLGITNRIMVRSGNGIHCYIPLSAPMEKKEWVSLSILLSGSLRYCKVDYDRSKIKDPSMVLRVPGTMNCKKEPIPVTILEDTDYSYDEFMLTEIFEQYQSDEIIPTREYQPKESSWGKNSATVSFEKISAECRQLKDISYNANVPEPLWYSAIGVAAACTEPEKAAIAWSINYSKYNEHVVLNKLNQWKSSTTGPATCTQFRNENPPGCMGCSKLGKITSPAQLGFDMSKVDYVIDVSMDDLADLPPSPPMEASHECDIDDEGYNEDEVGPLDPPVKVDFWADAKKVIPAGYSIDPEGRIWMMGGDDAALVADRAVYVSDANKFSSVTESQIMITLAVYDRKRNGSFHDVPINILSGATKGGDTLASKLANAGFVMKGAKHIKMVQDYLGLCAQHYIDEMAPGVIVRNMGWHDDSFVLGDKMFMPSGKTQLVKPKNSSDTIFKACTSTGNIDDWVKTTNVFRLKELVNHAFAFLCGFGSPLLNFMDINGAVVNLYSPDSGTGKSTVGLLINSIYGNPKELMFTAKDTENTIFNKLGTLNNLPGYVEEVSIWSGERISQFVYFVSGGKERGRLNRDATTKETAMWNTGIYTSSNCSFYDKLGEFSQSTEGEKQRILELNLSKTKSIAQYGKMINMAAARNYGVAGEIYLKHLVAMNKKGDLQTELDNASDAYTKKYNFSFTGAERFIEATVLTSWVGANIAHDLGIIDESMPIDYIFKHINNVIEDRRRSYVEHRVSAWDVLTNFVAKNSGKFAKVQTFLMTKESDGTCPDESLFGRIEYFYDARHAADSPIGGKLSVSYAEFQRYCSDCQHPFRSLIAELESLPSNAFVRHRAFLATGLLLTQRGAEVPKITSDAITVNVPEQMMKELNLVNTQGGLQ